MAQHSTDPSTDSMKKSSSCFSEKQGSSSSSHEPNTITTTTTTVASDLSAISMPHAMETSTHISAHPSSVSASLSVLCSDPDPDVPQQNPSTHHHHHQITMASSAHVPAAAHNLYGPVFPVAAPHNHHHLHHHHHHHHHPLHSAVSSSNTDSASPSQQHRSRHHRFLSASSSSSSSAPSTTMSSHLCSCHASTAALSWLSSTSAEIVEIENIPALSLVAEPELDALHPSTNRSSNRFGEDEGKNPQGMLVARQRSCEACRKRVGLVSGFKCKCGGLFCGVHRYSDRHNCSFDYKAAGREAIAKENPRVEAIKLVKI